jgi:carbamoyltransferase
VYNFGLPGTGTDQQYLTYKEYAEGFDHDLLLIAVLVENIQRVANRYRYWSDDAGATRLYAKPFYELVQGKLRLCGVPVPWKPIEESQLLPEDKIRLCPVSRFPRLKTLIAAIGMKDVHLRLRRHSLLSEYNNPADPAWCLMRAILERWIREHPKPVLLMPIPLHNFVEETSNPTAYQKRFREVREATGCFLHDPIEDLLRYPLIERRAFRYANDPHLTSTGHMALAKSLKSAIVSVLGD